MNRSLLYPAIRAIAANPVGQARGTLDHDLSESHRRRCQRPGRHPGRVDPLPRPVRQDVQRRHPQRRSHGPGKIQHRRRRSAGHRIHARGRPDRCLHRRAFDALRTTRAACNTVTPDPDVVGFCKELLTGPSAAAAQAVLNAIAADPNPAPLTPFKSIQSVTANAPSLTLPANQTVCTSAPPTSPSAAWSTPGARCTGGKCQLHPERHRLRQGLRHRLRQHSREVPVRSDRVRLARLHRSLWQRCRSPSTMSAAPCPRTTRRRQSPGGHRNSGIGHSDHPDRHRSRGLSAGLHRHQPTGTRHPHRHRPNLNYTSMAATPAATVSRSRSWTAKARFPAPRSTSRWLPQRRTRCLRAVRLPGWRPDRPEWWPGLFRGMARTRGVNDQGGVWDETTNVFFDNSTLDWDGVLNNGFPASPATGSPLCGGYERWQLESQYFPHACIQTRERWPARTEFSG